MNEQIARCSLPNRFIRAYSVVLGPQYEEDKREVLSAMQCADRGIAVGITEVRQASGAIEFGLHIRNGSDREISEIVFPDVELEPAGEETGFTMPVGPGWWLPFEPLDEGEKVTWNYPVFGSMQWVDYGSEDSGIYIGVHDEVPIIKLWTIGKRNGKPWVRIRFTDICLMPGESYDLPPVVVWEHGGDWHEGAALYRAWAESWMEKPSGAEWYDDAPAWCWFGFKNQHSTKANRIYADIPSGARTIAEHGVRLLNAAGWLEHGHDTHYPDYFAGKSLGGAEALTRAVDEAHKLGIRISFYTNGRIADPEGSIGSMPNWTNWAVKAPSRDTVRAMQHLHANFQPDANLDVAWNTSGTMIIETYGKVDFAVMCPGSQEWRELFVSRIEDMACNYHADGTFIDQICGAWAYPCYSDSHDHGRPNEAWSGYLELLRELRSRVRKVNPEFQMSTEGVCDILGQYFDVQQGHNDWDTQVGPKARPLPELYGYTFPWYTINTGFASRNNYYYLKLAHAVGSGIDLCDLERDCPEERFTAYVRLIMTWRKRYADVLRRGEFLGSLKCNSPHYLAHAFEKGKLIVVTTAWVPYKCDPVKPSEVKLRLRNRIVKSAVIYSEAGEGKVSASADGKDTVLTVPVTDIAVIELET